VLVVHPSFLHEDDEAARFGLEQVRAPATRRLPSPSPDGKTTTSDRTGSSVDSRSRPARTNHATKRDQCEDDTQRRTGSKRRLRRVVFQVVLVAYFCDSAMPNP
jgi:hypothetical protein